MVAAACLIDLQMMGSGLRLPEKTCTMSGLSSPAMVCSSNHLRTNRASVGIQRYLPSLVFMKKVPRCVFVGKIVSNKSTNLNQWLICASFSDRRVIRDRPESDIPLMHQPKRNCLALARCQAIIHLPKCYIVHASVVFMVLPWWPVDVQRPQNLRWSSSMKKNLLGAKIEKVAAGVT